MKVIRPFGPTIAKVSMSENLVKELNDYVDKTLVDKKKTEELNYGKMLAGNVQQEFLLDKEFTVLSGWESFLKENTEKWIFGSTQKKIKEFRIIAIIEGLSYLAFGITMPLKYMYEITEPNYVIGMLHGLVFLLYCLWLFILTLKKYCTIQKGILF